MKKVILPVGMPILGVTAATVAGDAPTERASASADLHSAAIWQRLEPVIARFQACWRGERPDIATFPPADETDRAALLPELVHAEIELKREVGEPVQIDDYLRRFPSLLDHPILDTQRGICPETLPIEGEGADSALVAFEHVGPGPQGHLVGHYRLEQEIGQGGFGVVYRAVDTALGRAVAVKLLRDGRLRSPLKSRGWCGRPQHGRFEPSEYRASLQ